MPRAYKYFSDWHLYKKFHVDIKKSSIVLYLTNPLYFRTDLFMVIINYKPQIWDKKPNNH